MVVLSEEQQVREVRSANRRVVAVFLRRIVQTWYMSGAERQKWDTGPPHG